MKSLVIGGCALALGGCGGMEVAGASMALQGVGLVGEGLGWIDSSPASARHNVVASAGYAFNPYSVISRPEAPSGASDFIQSRPMLTPR